MAINSPTGALLGSRITNDPNASDDMLAVKMTQAAPDAVTDPLRAAFEEAKALTNKAYDEKARLLREARTAPSGMERLRGALLAAAVPSRGGSNWDALRQGLSAWNESGEAAREAEEKQRLGEMGLEAERNMSLAELAMKYKPEKGGGTRKVATNPVTGEYYLTDIQEGEPSVTTLGRPGAPPASGAKVVAFTDPVTGRPTPYIEETNLKGETRREPLKEAPRTAEEEAAFQTTVQSRVEANKRREAAKAALPKLVTDVNYSVGLIDKALSHPGLSAVVGFPDPFKGGFGGERAWPGSPAAGFLTIQKQLSGQQFLAAYESLKGTGQITEIEGKKATEAMARLQSAQSEEEFRAALQELRGLLLTGLQRTRQAAGPVQGAAPAQSKPAAGAPAQTLRYDPKTKSFQPVK